MDADRRRKTVIAGTFAIASKSLSNAPPISVAESLASDASANRPLEGIYARGLPHSRIFIGSNGAGEQGGARPSTIPGNLASGSGRGKIEVAAARSRFALAICFPSFPTRQFF
jgi:hypothetical protein